MPPAHTLDQAAEPVPAAHRRSAPGQVNTNAREPDTPQAPGGRCVVALDDAAQASRSCRSLAIRIRSRHSRRAGRRPLPPIAFARGARPALEDPHTHGRDTASNAAVNLASRSRMRNSGPTALDSSLAQGFRPRRTFVLVGTQCTSASLVMRIRLPQTLAAARTTARGEISGSLQPLAATGIGWGCLPGCSLCAATG